MKFFRGTPSITRGTSAAEHWCGQSKLTWKIRYVCNAVCYLIIGLHLQIPNFGALIPHLLYQIQTSCESVDRKWTTKAFFVIDNQLERSSSTRRFVIYATSRLTNFDGRPLYTQWRNWQGARGRAAPPGKLKVKTGPPSVDILIFSIL